VLAASQKKYVGEVLAASQKRIGRRSACRFPKKEKNEII